MRLPAMTTFEPREIRRPLDSTVERRSDSTWRVTHKAIFAPLSGALGPEASGRGDSASKALVAALGLHALVLAVLSLSMHREPEEVPVPRVRDAMAVSVSTGDGSSTLPPAPQVSASVESPPSPVEDPVGVTDEPVEASSPEQSDVLSTEAAASDAPPSASAASGGAEGTVWTPPQPGMSPSASFLSTTRPPAQRIVMPVVTMGEGAAPAVLLSYDQGRFSDAAVTAEARRLSEAGTILMSATVGADGAVSDCVVTSSSGSPDLDRRGCALVRSYRYRPARDALGKSYISIVSEVLEWAKDGKFSPMVPDAAPAAPVASTASKRR